MARTVPGRTGEGIRIPDPVRHLSGLPIVAGGATPTGPTGQWRDVGLARNLAWVADGMGTALGMTWRGTALSGALASTMRVRLPVPSASHARVRLRVWATGNAANNAAISIASATVGPSSVTVGNGPAGRYPAPGADVIIDAGADVVVDADAGPYVDLTVVTTGTWGALESVHLDLVEAGAPANYPTNDTALAAGIVGDFVAADTSDYVAGLPLGADTLFEHLEQWDEQWDRRKAVMCWAEFNRTGGELPPRRLRPVLRVPTGGGLRVTIAAYLPVVSNTTRVTIHRDDGEPTRPGNAVLGALEVAPPDAAGWHMTTTTIRFDGVDLGSPSVGLDALVSLIVRCTGAAPILDGGGVGDAAQVSATADAVHSISVWVG